MSEIKRNEGSWEMAIAYAEKLLIEAQHDAERAKRRVGRLRVSIKLMQGLRADGVPWPGGTN